jgi:hypothetical protein
MPATYPRLVILSGNSTKIVFDFGIEIGGLVFISYTANSTGAIGLAFTETST